MSQWIVLLNTGTDTRHAYGPISDAETANRFAAFLTREVDPAQPIRLIDPLDETLANWRNRTDSGSKPDSWPPKPGEVWQDRHGDRWIYAETGTGHSYLVCLSKRGDDSADEIWDRFGPLTLIQSIPTQDEELPF